MRALAIDHPPSVVQQEKDVMPKDSGRNRTHQSRCAANQRQAGKENSP
jgi:hypothetical protein